jgi:hypothetical protein
MAYIQKGSPFKQTDPNKKVEKKNLSGYNANVGGYQVGQEVTTTEVIVPSDPAASINNVYQGSAGDKLKRPSGITGAVGSDKRKAEYDAKGWAYDHTIAGDHEGAYGTSQAWDAMQERVIPQMPKVESKNVDLNMGQSNMGQTNTTKNTRLDTLYTRDIGDAQGSYARRKNIRSGKVSSRVEKNQSIKEARLQAKKDNLKGSEKREFIKNAKLNAKIKQSQSNKNIAASENKNARNQSLQNIKVGGKVKGDARIVGKGDGAEIVKKSREEVAAANAPLSFKMGGYGSKNKNK